MSKLKSFLVWAGLVAMAIGLFALIPPSAGGDRIALELIPILFIGVTFNKFQAFAEHVYEGVHNLGSHALTYALTNAAPAAGNSVLADLTQITYTNLSSRVPTISSSSQSGGTYKLVLADLVLTSSGGSTGPLRYVVLYNDTPTSPADPLVGYWDYGSSITLADTETFTIDADATNGVLQHA